MVFLDNPEYNHGQGMRIHIRTKKIRWWSYVESVAVQIGDDVLEVHGGTLVDTKYWVNGVQGPYEEDSHVLPFTIGGLNVRFRVLTETIVQYKIFLEDGQSIVLKSVKDWMRIELDDHTAATFGSSKGLLGTYETGLMMGRDGMTVFEDADAFGLDWQVHYDEPLLFHSVDGPQHPVTCEMPGVMEESTKRRLGERKVSEKAAARACMHVPAADKEDCIADVLATDDVDMAGAF